MRSTSIDVREATPHDLPALESAWPTRGAHASHMVAVERGDAAAAAAAMEEHMASAAERLRATLDASRGIER